MAAAGRAIPSPPPTGEAGRGRRQVGSKPSGPGQGRGRTGIPSPPPTGEAGRGRRPGLLAALGAGVTSGGRPGLWVCVPPTPQPPSPAVSAASVAPRRDSCRATALGGAPTTATRRLALAAAVQRRVLHPRLLLPGRPAGHRTRRTRPRRPGSCSVRRRANPLALASGGHPGDPVRERRGVLGPRCRDRGHSGRTGGAGMTIPPPSLPRRGRRSPTAPRRVGHYME